MRPKLIVIDGKTYNSVNEMPEDVRRLYDQAMRSFKDQDGNRVPDAIDPVNPLEDKNRNGIPDIIEGTAGAPIVANAFKVLMDGKEYNSLDELPPEARAKYEQAMGALDANRNGIPDFVEGMLGSSVQTPHTIHTAGESHTAHHSPRQAVPAAPTIEPDRPNGLLIALLGIALFGLCLMGAAGVWYFFLR